MKEEIRRRRERAARFNTTDTLASYQPAVDLEEAEKRRKRAEKFGTKYQADDAAGLMDVGARPPAFFAASRRLLLYPEGLCRVDNVRVSRVAAK